LHASIYTTGRRKLPAERRAAILSALVEGNSIASTCRMLGVNKVTVLRLLADAGTLSAKLHDELVRNLATKRIQADELWAFVGAKEENTTPEAKLLLKWGDTWTWTAIDADSKLMIAWYVGPRDGISAYDFMGNVARRVTGRVQITTDGHRAYKNAVGTCFDVDTRSDYAQCIKLYGNEGPVGPKRYSPNECTGVEIKVCWGNPDPDHISTSYSERSNLTVRMGNRRFTRLTNAHSKKIENHVHAITLQCFHYNFMRKHMTLKTTPAVMAGVADREWRMLDFVKLLEREEEKNGGRLTDYKMAASKRQSA
jgi:IS1 family transposase